MSHFQPPFFIMWLIFQTDNRRTTCPYVHSFDSFFPLFFFTPPFLPLFFVLSLSLRIYIYIYISIYLSNVGPGPSSTGLSRVQGPGVPQALRPRAGSLGPWGGILGAEGGPWGPDGRLWRALRSSIYIYIYIYTPPLCNLWDIRVKVKRDVDLKRIRGSETRREKIKEGSNTPRTTNQGRWTVASLRTLRQNRK